MGIGLILFVFALLTGAPRASEVPWYVGETVGEVKIESIQGAVQGQDLKPILRVRAGQDFDPGDLRADVALLVQTGGFAAVEAFVQPMDQIGESDGPARTVVRVVYQVLNAPRVQALRVRGARGPAKRVVSGVLGVDLGDPWFGAEDSSGLISRVKRQLNVRGWTRAEVAVQVDEGPDSVELDVVIKLNDPQLVRSIRVGGTVPVPERLVRRWLAKSGIKIGQRVAAAEQEIGRKRVLEELRARGWDRARVNLFSREESDANEVAINVLIASGSQLVIDAKGPKLPNKRILRDTLGIRGGDRITDHLQADAKQRLEAWYANRGFLKAKVVLELEKDTDSFTRIKVVAKSGPRHWTGKFQWTGETPLKSREMLGIVLDASHDALGAGILTIEGVAEAEEGLQDRFNADGYLDAAVTIETREGGSGWVGFPFRFGVPMDLNVKIQVGSQVLLEALNVRGGIGHEAALVDVWKQENEGKPLNAQAAASLEKAILQEYESVGYLEVRTALKIIRSRADDTAVVDINIVPGDQVQLRSIVIRGNRRTHRHVVEREIMLSVGEPISPKAIAQTRSNLYNLDLFRLVSPELIGEEVGSQDLLLRLEERSNILLEAGGGVSTDEGVRTTGRATHRNVGGLGHRFTTLGTIGYGWFGDEWTLDTASPVWRAATRYELPYVPGRGGRLVLEGLIHETIQEPTWRLSRSGGAVGLKMRLSDRAEAMVDYRVQVRRLVDVDPGSLVNGDPWLPYLGLSEDLAGDPILESGKRVVSGGSLLLVVDARDDRFDPKSGTLWSTHFEVGDGVFSGDVTMRATAKLERLIPLGPVVLDLVGRGGLGIAQGNRSTLPLEERFFLGGGTTLRGFSTNSVGPANFARRPQIDHPSQTEPVIDGLALASGSGQWVATGGDAMAAASVELRIPMPLLGFRRMDGVDLVLFSDMGHVGFLDSTIVTTSRLESADPWLRVSVGAGLRFSTPVGPASLDLGINTSPIRERNEPVFLPHLTLGVL